MDKQEFQKAVDAAVKSSGFTHLHVVHNGKRVLVKDLAAAETRKLVKESMVAALLHAAGVADTSATDSLTFIQLKQLAKDIGELE